MQTPIGMTNSLELSEAKTVRKLAASELFLVLQGPEVIDGLQRVHGRALQDNAEGWRLAGEVYASTNVRDDQLRRIEDKSKINER